MSLQLKQEFVYGGITYASIERIHDVLTLIRVQLGGDKGPYWTCGKSVFYTLSELVTELKNQVRVKEAYGNHNRPELKPVCSELLAILGELDEIAAELPFFQIRRYIWVKLWDRLWGSFKDMPRVSSLSMPQGDVAYFLLSEIQERALALMHKAIVCLPDEIIQHTK